MEQEWAAIQEWIHLIFSFHQKEVTKETMSDLKQALATHQENKHFTFTINEQRAVILSFSQGEVSIRPQNNQLVVEIDEKTKKAVYDLKELVQQQKKEETKRNSDNYFEELALFSEKEF